jgi:citrate lyase beta subunit
MTKQPQTSACPFALHGLHDVLEASAGIPVHEALDAATGRLEALVAGLRELMQEPAVTQLATLTFYAAEAALALVYASHAGVDPGQRGAA